MRFGADIAPEVNALLQQAAAAVDNPQRREALLEQAHQRDAEELAVDQARYKFYCYAGRLSEAETVARSALRKAAEQGGFVDDWQALSSADFLVADADSPQRHYLYGMKALAFIKLRWGQTNQAKTILAELARLDPQDRVGACVVREIAGEDDD